MDEIIRGKSFLCRHKRNIQIRANGVGVRDELGGAVDDVEGLAIVNNVRKISVAITEWKTTVKDRTIPNENRARSGAANEFCE